MAIKKNKDSTNFSHGQHLIIKSLRPRKYVPNYRETSPDKIILNNQVYKLNTKSHNIKITKKNIIKKNTVRRYKKVSCSKQLNNESEKSSDKEDNKVVDKEDIEDQTKEPKYNPEPDDSLRQTDDSNAKNSQENERRYPVRLRKQRTEVYVVDRNFKRPKKNDWNDSILSPIDGVLTKAESNSLHRHHHRQFGLYSSRKHSTSDTNSDGADSDDERKFERRRQKSVFRARSELIPINRSSREFRSELCNDNALDIRGNFNIKQRSANLADIEPMVIDKSVTFSSIGGNKHCIQALKESVLLPLMYPEIFEKLSIIPPRGLLFYGPPGSGKTLVARALVNECQLSNGKMISFFMRKGADCLSKWVGESERQLRLLFDQAYRMRPSIIFFDEIDGLAPVRSSRQDQIHSSIVSTLLSLIDGLDDRGDIIVIGATNRLDAIDPALRRPGRFDREFLFPLPDKQTRSEILAIHTANWQPPLSSETIQRITEATNGFSGADLKAIVVEAGLCTIRRRYPQIYKNPKKLKLDLNQIQVTEADIDSALRLIRPSHERAVLPTFYRLPDRITQLLQPNINRLHHSIMHVFQSLSIPIHRQQHGSSNHSHNKLLYKPRLILAGFGLDELLSLVLHDISGIKILKFDSVQLASSSSISSTNHIMNASSSQSSALNNSNLEERLYQLFLEAERNHQTIILLANIDLLFHSLELTGQTLLLQLLTRPISTVNNYCRLNTANISNTQLVSMENIGDPVTMVVGTLSPAAMALLDENRTKDLYSVIGDDLDSRSLAIWREISKFLTTSPPSIHLPSTSHIHGKHSMNQKTPEEPFILIQPPDFQQRFDYFSCLLNEALQPVIFNGHNNSMKMCNGDATTSGDCNDLTINTDVNHCFLDPNHEEILSEVELETPKPLSADESKRLEMEEEMILRKFRMSLRKVVASLAKERKFQIFSSPVEKADYPDYYKVITNPMDLSTIRQKIDIHCYKLLEEFRTDLNLVSVNALFYNPPRTNYLRDIRRHAYDFVDYAEATIDEHIGQDFEKVLQDIEASRNARNFYNPPCSNHRNDIANIGTNSSISSSSLNVPVANNSNTRSTRKRKYDEDVGEYLSEINAGTKLQDGPLLNTQLDVYHKFYQKNTTTKSKHAPEQLPIHTNDDASNSRVTRSQLNLRNRNQERNKTTANSTKPLSQSDSELLSNHSNHGHNSHTANNKARSQSVGFGKAEVNCGLIKKNSGPSDEEICTPLATSSLFIHTSQPNSPHHKSGVSKPENSQLSKLKQPLSSAPVKPINTNATDSSFTCNNARNKKSFSNMNLATSTPNCNSDLNLTDLIKLDKNEMSQVFEEAASKTETITNLAQLEHVYFMFLTEIRKFARTANRTKLPKNLRKMISSYEI